MHFKDAPEAVGVVRNSEGGGGTENEDAVRVWESGNRDREWDRRAGDVLGEEAPAVLSVVYIHVVFIKSGLEAEAGGIPEAEKPQGELEQ